MASLATLTLLQFKNHGENRLEFPAKVTAICGSNGSGKTNLLEAIYYLCLTKSYFGYTDQQMVSFESKGMRLSGEFINEKNERLTATAIIRENGKKEFSLDGETYSRLSKHLGKFTAVMIAPDDTILITGVSENRRKWLDALICQTDDSYLQNLIAYNKLLQQRNSLLKQMADGSPSGNDLLEVLDHQLCTPMLQIYNTRQKVLKELLPSVAEHYASIAAGAESPSFAYRSISTESVPVVNEKNIMDQLQVQRHKDLALQRSTWGTHRDDILIMQGEDAFKVFASQGQRKSMLFALKLAEYEWLEKEKGFSPILLLDDVFEKLDDNRMLNLLKEVCVEKAGQVFITDTHRERLEMQLLAVGAEFNLIEL